MVSAMMGYSTHGNYIMSDLDLKSWFDVGMLTTVGPNNDSIKDTEVDILA